MRGFQAAKLIRPPLNPHIPTRRHYLLLPVYSCQMFGIVLFKHHLKDGVKKHRRTTKMAYVGVGETSALGYLPNDGHVFINVHARLKRTHNPELHIKTAHPHYLIHRFIDANTFKYERHIDNCFKVPTEHAKEFLRFVQPINQDLEDVDATAKRLDKTVSDEAAEIADLDTFHTRMWKCHTLIDEVGILKHDAKGHKLVLDTVTQHRQQGVRGITRWHEYVRTSISAELARAYETEYKECHKVKVTGYLTLKHKPQEQQPHELDLERVYSADELRAHYRTYVDLLAKQKRIEDLLAVEKKHLKAAIGKAKSVRMMFSWSRREVNEFDSPTFRRLYPDLYEKCKVTSEPKWKCEILPFRG